MSALESCLFCGIYEKKIPAKIIAQNDRVLAFHDINPVAEFHALVIPKLHIANLNELSADNASVLADMMLMAKEIAFQFGMNTNGYRVVLNTEKGAGQTVFHLHAHVLGGRNFSWPPG
ncbi:MAG: histidine triad nucleotide-binding protein [Myxococcales bacterium]|nr:histidine triad nucleotide-binding protein [Myxococcales bacterium]USN51571.1 MAG: histidine triad nucleotide-binding protein [Myxococcales bacterium]